MGICIILFQLFVCPFHVLFYPYLSLLFTCCHCLYLSSSFPLFRSLFAYLHPLSLTLSLFFACFSLSHHTFSLPKNVTLFREMNECVSWAPFVTLNLFQYDSPKSHGFASGSFQNQIQALRYCRTISRAPHYYSI